jgi:hypothetical protein
MDFSRKTKIVVEFGLCVASQIACFGVFLQRFAREAVEYYGTQVFMGTWLASCPW